MGPNFLCTISAELKASSHFKMSLSGLFFESRLKKSWWWSSCNFNSFEAFRVGKKQLNALLGAPVLVVRPLVHFNGRVSMQSLHTNERKNVKAFLLLTV